jgi:hypothetical protein
MKGVKLKVNLSLYLTKYYTMKMYLSFKHETMTTCWVSAGIAPFYASHTHIQVICFRRTYVRTVEGKVKLKVLLRFFYLSTTPWGHVGEWRCSSIHS